ncbi:MAG: radical SAM protein [Tatlockia sp.]|jgi:radical SAM protein with 4Fe4S-binding SPASM domain|nr:radical SAM protein [Tatlockia sp.]
MRRPEIRIRKESFGYTLVFSDGHIGFYDNNVGNLLLNGSTREELEEHRIAHIPITPDFHLSAPLMVWFEITRGCNLPCKHCYVAAGPQRKNELSTEEIFNILEQLKASGVFALVLVGGEPMMHPDFLPILNYAHKLGFVLSVATNGTYITQEIIDNLPREECVISVSLDGKAFQKELRILSTFEQIHERLMLLKKNGIKTALMTTTTNQNIHEIEEIFEYAREHRFFFGGAPFSPIGRGKSFPQYTPTEKIAERSARLYIQDYLHDDEMMAETGLCVAKFLYESYKLSFAMRREFCGISLAYILADGSVYPCSVCASTYKYQAGNLRENSFREIWENGFGKIRSITFDDFKGCANCELSAPEYFCSSRCPVMSEVYTGDPTQCGSNDFLKATLKKRTELLKEMKIY